MLQLYCRKSIWIIKNVSCNYVLNTTKLQKRFLYIDVVESSVNEDKKLVN